MPRRSQVVTTTQRLLVRIQNNKFYLCVNFPIPFCLCIRMFRGTLCLLVATIGDGCFDGGGSSVFWSEYEEEEKMK